MNLVNKLKHYYTKETIDLAKSTTIKLGTMLLVSHILEVYIHRNGNGILNKEWIKVSLFTIIGFIVYDFFIYPFFYIELNNEDFELAINRAINIITFLSVEKLLSGLFNHKKLNINKKDIINMIYIIIGFTTYDLVTKHFIPKISDKYQIAIDTLVQFITMFTVTRLLLRKPFDEEFFRSTIYVLIGFLTYDLYIDNLLNLEDVMTP